MHISSHLSQKTLIICPVIKSLYFSSKRKRDLCFIQEEAIGLAQAINLDVMDCVALKIERVHVAHFLGKGKIEEYKEYISGNNITLVIINYPLSPIQQRNLESTWDCKVIDRTALIIAIFGERAYTREGKLQVELASLEYEKSRLVRSWKHLERQRGGFGFLGGPGETQLETDRRLLQERISTLKQQLAHVEHTRALHRNARRSYPKVALVGYTNAGKSTLFNSLSGAKSFEADALFATLDPTMRLVNLPSHAPVIFSDTVGFITNLPTELIAAFKATLEEVVEADLILHICDISHPEVALHKKEVLRILKQLNVTSSTHTILEVHNKIDLDEKNASKREKTLDELAVQISAKTKAGLPLLLHRVEALLHQGHILCEITLNASEGKRLAWLYQHAHVQKREDIENNIILQVKMMHHTKKLWDILS